MREVVRQHTPKHRQVQGDVPNVRLSDVVFVRCRRPRRKISHGRSIQHPTEPARKTGPRLSQAQMCLLACRTLPFRD